MKILSQFLIQLCIYIILNLAINQSFINKGMNENEHEQLKGFKSK